MAERPPQHEAGLPAGGWVSVFVRRPVLTFVINLLIIVAGIAALRAIEVRELPNVDRPVVTVRTSYAGATPETIDAQVTAIIESAVSRVAGVSAISSSSSYGESRIVVEFSTERDLDNAAMDVRDAVAAVVNRLPRDRTEDPRVIKADADASPIMRLAIASSRLSEGELTDLVKNVIEDRLSAVDGVAAATSYGLREKVIEVRVSPVALAARGLALTDLMAALAAASVTAPAGALENASQQLLVRAEAPVTTPRHVADLEINPRTKVGDVAFVRWGFQDATAITRLDGTTAIGLEIVRQAQSNTIAVSDGVRRAVEELRRLLPEGVQIAVTSDEATFIRDSIREVVTSLLAATVIVVLVIVLFLRSFRAALAPAIAIPVSLVGTIAAIWLSGFSINILTLLALVVATGLVVDDAIVVLENIARHRAMGAGPRAAAVLGTREIVFAVLSTTATLAAVFIPISFLPGMVGSLFSEFGFVLAFAVTVSSLVALTLGPVLAARFGTGKSAGPDDAGWLVRGAGLAGAAYAWLLDRCLYRPWLVGVSVALAAGGFFAYRSLPVEITPTEDRGIVLLRLATQQGSNLRYTSEKVEAVERALRDLQQRGEVTGVLAMVGRGGANRGFAVAPLAPWSERSRSQQQIQAELQQRLADIPGLTVSVLAANSLRIRGGGQGLRFAVIGPSYERLSESATRLTQRLMETPGFRSARTDFDTTQPQIAVRINREAASTLGVPIAAITSLINAMIDHGKAAELFIEDEIVEVHVRAGGRPIDDPNDLKNLFVRTADGQFITLSSLVSIDEVAISPTLGREDRRRAIPITAGLDEGFRLGDAIPAMRALAAEILEPDTSVVLLGEARTLEQTTESQAFVFAIALLVVFLVLAAQFESVVSALVILFTVPFGLAAAALAILLTGGTLNVYSQIGLVLLVGVMAKNGILIVEFANQRRDAGLDVLTAVREAAVVRLRAVVMTMVSTVLGALPLILASGAGAEARLALGWVIFGGLGFAAVFTLFLTPVAYRILAPLSQPRAAEGKLLAEELGAIATSASLANEPGRAADTRSAGLASRDA